MILVTGPAAAGKRAFVSERFGYAESQMADAIIDRRPVIYNAETLAFAQPELVNDLAEQLKDKEVVIVNELGAGVIPATRPQRDGRDAAGRLSVLLAREAQSVYRVICGLPQKIK